MCVATCGFIKVQESTNQSKKIFVNFTENLLLDETFRALPASVTILEILEDVTPSEQIIEILIHAKQDGYLIAIDDFHGEAGKEELLNLADIIKIDVLNKSNEQISHIYDSLRENKALKLAEKVDSKDSFDFLHGLGFDYFQGYFFLSTC